MDLLDSASLRYGDCFGMPMQEAGRYAYAILPAFGHHLAFDYPFEVSVSEKAQKRPPAQLDIMVGFRDGRLTATPAKAEVGLGTMICWNAEDETVPGFMVIAKDRSFASDPLSGPSIYSHRFRHQDDYSWIDRHGGPISGKITIVSPDPCDKRGLERWNRQVQQALLVSIPDEAGAELRAVVGQPVIFIIDDAAGISITEERCMEMDYCGPTNAESGTTRETEAKS
jgi:hypothetical protein